MTDTHSLNSNNFGARGRPVHGAKLGIIILDTRFQRFPGDIGYAGSFDFPVLYSVAHGFSLGADLKPDDKTLAVFYKAMDELIALGVDGISTSCGFLSIMQPHLAARSPVPVGTSSLMQVPIIQRMLPAGKTVGVLTAKASSLTREHFEPIGASFDIPIAGMPDDSEFRLNMERSNTRIDRSVQEKEVLTAAEAFARKHPEMGAMVLECTNLSPYSARIHEMLNIPVYDIITFLKWFHAGLAPTTYR